ncbi:MAG: hypothetical protein ACRDJ5_00900 [Actinomycetota bacterium]
MRTNRFMKALFVALMLLSVARAAGLYGGVARPETKVGLVYDPATLGEHTAVRDAYGSVMQEEGIPHRWISTRDVLLIDGRELAHRFEALIFPDALAQRMPAEILDRVREFVHAGGDIAVVLDPGIKDTANAYRSGGVLAPLVGIQYQRYRTEREHAYTEGRLDFRSTAQTRAWGIPPGKLYNGQVVGGYSYGGLVYPMASASPLRRDVEVFASFRDIPVLAERSVGRGRALWVNLPLGYLKAYGDDLPLRTIMRTFLFDIVEIPHLVPTPGGVGGLVLDWHIDSQIEWEGIPALIESGIVRRGLRQQFDVTAGPYRDYPGDGLGFDACGLGAPYLRSLLPYGEVGSHGAWSHNHSSELLEEGKLSPDRLRALVRANNACLEEITGERVRSYSAPNGVHPQPLATEVVEDMAIRAYYYTGDTGSAPNRTFSRGRMVSEEAWAFPVMPNGIYASIGEMIKEGQSASEVGEWLHGTLDYVLDEHTTRLVYSHPYDLRSPAYRDEFVRFVDRAERLQRKGELTVQTMGYFAGFLSRFVDTDASFTREAGRLVVSLRNERGLEDVSFRIPERDLAPSREIPEGLTRVGSADGYVTFAVTSDVIELTAALPLAP